MIGWGLFFTLIILIVSFFIELNRTPWGYCYSSWWKEYVVYVIAWSIIGIGWILILGYKFGFLKML